MDSYHLRRVDKALEDPAVLGEILSSQKLMTLAFCRGSDPYLVTVNHGYDAASRCLFFHCAPVGKKIDFLRANPAVWGTVVQDLGYLPGECDHAYRSVHFSGRASFVEGEADKRRALTVMIDQLEPDPEPVKARVLTPEKIRGVTIVRIDIDSMTGKAGPATRPS